MRAHILLSLFVGVILTACRAVPGKTGEPGADGADGADAGYEYVCSRRNGRGQRDAR